MNANKDSKPATFRDLLVWQKGMGLSLAAIKLTAAFPATDDTGLGGRIRRTAIDVPATLADAHARHNPGEFLQAVTATTGLASALETLVRLAVELRLCANAEAAPVLDLIDAERRVLFGLRRSIQGRAESGR